jgi:CAAX prenyl protease-like protein
MERERQDQRLHRRPPRAARLKQPAFAPYVLPFGVFLLFLAIRPILPVPQWARFAIELAVILAISRSVLDKAPSRPFFSILLGIAVFLLWVAPEHFYPAWRSLPPFHNSVVGAATATTTEAEKHGIFFLAFRVLMSVVAIPILEELFWRGFLMRWLINRDFRSIPLGTWNIEAFLIVAILFATEHGPYWDVGLLTGFIYNAWMIRTRNLWDCILAHATTNACLAAFVIGGGHWQYWL